MSLLGRLEDLSLTDIIQIVFLSRRTGILEIIDEGGRHTVLFRNGLIVNASAPQHPDLVEWLHRRGTIPEFEVATVRKMEDTGIACGTAVLDMNLATLEELADAVRDRILDVVTPLLDSREGEFNFILAESMSSVDVEYEPEQVFKDGGFSPQRIIGSGENLKPLRGLEESLKAGKALVRGTAPAAPPPSIEELPFPEAAPLPEPAAPASPPPSQFKVKGGLFAVESPDAANRNVILFERNPLIRVAAKRAFGKSGFKVAQFGSLDEARGEMTEFFRSSSFFVTFLEYTDDEASVRLMHQLKRRNPRLPVVIIDHEAGIRRRHDLIRAGADLYLTKPSADRLQPGVAEEELTLFADELVLFAERAFDQWQQAMGGGLDAGRRFYEEADKANLDRSFSLLQGLINEVSNPNDIDQVSSTILRLAEEYLDRGAIFMATDGQFVGLGGFGITGTTDEMPARVKALRLSRHEPSILADVAAVGEPHRGKMRRTAGNVTLIETLGGLLPTEVVALPILHDGRTIGILYGDNAEHRAPIDSLTGLEIFLSQAGYAFGNAAKASGRGG
ncbi:MAG TPA: response regulator [Thermoanaerobaculia bacterium]|nr:response regulator [Thermoanaerobaculia bacterium]